LLIPIDNTPELNISDSEEEKDDDLDLDTSINSNLEITSQEIPKQQKEP